MKINKKYIYNKVTKYLSKYIKLVFKWVLFKPINKSKTTIHFAKMYAKIINLCFK